MINDRLIVEEPEMELKDYLREVRAFFDPKGMMPHIKDTVGTIVFVGTLYLCSMMRNNNYNEPEKIYGRLENAALIHNPNH